MDVVLVGLPGSGKSAVARRLAKHHGAQLVDLDESIESLAGRPIPDIFAAEGEAGFRSHERDAIARLGPADETPAVHRVISTGGGAVVDPRNRWVLYRDRLPVWLSVRPEIAAQRLRRSHVERPLVAGRDPIGAVRALAAARERFYAAGVEVDGHAEVASVVRQVEHAIEGRRTQGAGQGTALLRARTRIGDIVLGDGIAATEIARVLDGLGRRRTVVLSEPGAWSIVGEDLLAALRRSALAVDVVLLPQGEPAKRLSIVESVARELARLRVERSDVIVAVGGGALGDTAGFVAATWLRGVRIVHLPTTLVAQIDSSIGGKTAVDLPEGKNLVGAFHQPQAVVADVSLLRTLPERETRAALGEAVKMAVLGDERLFELLEERGEELATGAESAFASGAVAELVERCAWAKVEVVAADEREVGSAGGRIALNLGHSLGHAVEAAGGYEDLRHGEAVAFGLRAAVGLGRSLGITPDARAGRILALLERLGLGRGVLPYSPEAVRAALVADKKHAGGRLRWVLPDETGVVVRDDVSDELVEAAIADLVGAEVAA
ncbi:MAG TPA: bifunctional shikimate kinase/3-dehydroquinate synthase [Candidatus Limnocylindrales bacterium]